MKRRSGFNKMIDKAKAGEYDLIVTREVCRFMRNATLIKLPKEKVHGMSLA